MSKRLYVAYGSNLNIAQMKHRCPTAKLYGTGTLEGYELQFKGYPSSAFATIAPKAGSSVPVAVWDIKPNDEKNLDRYEGYPSHYFKKDVTVNLGNQEVSAMVYIMNQKMRFGLPSTGYYDTVLTGYKDCGLDTSALETALKESTQQFYSSAVRHSPQMSFYDFGEDEDEDEEMSEEEELEGEEEPDMEASIGEALGINVDAAERDMLTTRIKQLETEMMSKIDMSIGQGLSIEDSESEFKRISDEISQLTSRLNALNEQGKTDEDRQRRIEDVKAGLEQFKDCTTVYNDTAVRKMIECIRVYSDGALDVIFGGGYTIHDRVEIVGK